MFSGPLPRIPSPPFSQSCPSTTNSSVEGLLFFPNRRSGVGGGNKLIIGIRECVGSDVPRRSVHGTQRTRKQKKKTNNKKKNTSHHRSRRPQRLIHTHTRMCGSRRVKRGRWMGVHSSRLPVLVTPTTYTAVMVRTAARTRVCT